MLRVLSRLLLRSPPIEPARYRAAEQRFGDWQHAQANDAEIWDREQNKAEIEAAIALGKTDPTAYFSRLLTLADSGSVWSMIRVGRAYETGAGVASDLALAETWLRRACDLGSDRAILLYCRLVRLKGERQKCVEACQAGAARDRAPALYWLAHDRLRPSPTRQTLKEVYPLLERATEQGDLFAEKVLSRKMLSGQLGIGRIPEGYRLATDYFKRMSAMYDELASQKGAR